MNRKLADIQKASAKLNRSYLAVFSTPDGKAVLDDLCRNFDHNNLCRKSPDGVVDPNASMVAIGSHKVIKHIEERIDDGQLAR